MQIIYIMGKSSAGKDTIYKKLKEILDIDPYVLYTTRPMRKGEQEGIDYNYITEDILKNLKGKVIESRTYNTVYGPWTYATVIDNQFNSHKDLIMTGTLESYNKVKEYFLNDKEIKILPIYIEVEDGIRLERALKRERQQDNPQYEEMCRRFISDSKDFSEENIINAGITKRFSNIDIEECINDIIKYINNNNDIKYKEK